MDLSQVCQSILQLPTPHSNVRFEPILWKNNVLRAQKVSI
jgi:hypothetical protein